MISKPERLAMLKISNHMVKLVRNVIENLEELQNTVNKKNNLPKTLFSFSITYSNFAIL